MSAGQITLSGEIIRTTDRAVLFRSETGDETWIPRSVCPGGEDLEDGDTDILVARWFAEGEGLA